MSTQRDDIYRQQGLGGTSGMGRRCGLVLVDFVNGFVDAHQLCGPHMEAAAHASVSLATAAGRTPAEMTTKDRVVAPSQVRRAAVRPRSAMITATAQLIARSPAAAG